MFQTLDMFSTAMAMARHAGQAQAVSAQNIANADTPRYRARQMPAFAETLRDTRAGQRATRARHLHGSLSQQTQPTLRRDAQDPNGNTVSLELEMMNAVGAKRQHDRALAIYRHALTVLRTSISQK